MSVQAISVDFWNTLVVAITGDGDRQARRLDRLDLACREADRPYARETLGAAFESARRRFTRSWLGERRTPPADTFVRWIWDELGVSIPDDAHDRTVHDFRTILLDHPPALAPGAADTLTALAERYPIAIISDTMLSPGSTIRRLLERWDVSDLFSGFVFSDESGFAKPDPRAFEAAAGLLGTTTGRLMHIGDLRPTDVAGARATGARAVLFTGIHHDRSEGPEPDLVLDTWPGLLEHA